MKLAYITQWFSYEYGGPVYHLLKKLSEHIDVVCIHARQKHIQYFAKGDRYLKKFEWISPHFKVHRFESIGIGNILFPLDLEEILEKEKPDIIQTDEFFTFTTIKAGKWAKVNRVPLIINSRMRYRQGFLRNIILHIFRYIAKGSVEYSKVIIATQGEESKREFLRWFPKVNNKIIIIPSAIDSKIFRIGKNKAFEFRKKYGIPPAKIILNVARIYPVKRIDLLIKAFYLVRKKYSNVVLVVVGPYEKKEMKKILQLIYELKLTLNKDIFFTGPIPHEEIGSAFASADIFVNTSETEGICYSFLEAMCFSIPIVAWNVGGNSFVLPSEVLVRFGDIKSLSNKIIELLQNKSKRKKICKILKNNLKTKFDMNKNLQKLLEIYRSSKLERYGN